MSAPVAGRKTDTAAMLALATGMLAPAEESDEEALMYQERHSEGDSAAEVFRRRTNKEPPDVARSSGLFADNGPAVHLGIASLTRRKLNNRTLAAALANRRVRVSGNADTDRLCRRAALFAADSGGGIPWTNIGEQVMDSSPNAPYGRHDSPRRLAAPLILGVDLEIIHMGDLARAESARPRLAPIAYQLARKRALSALDELIASLDKQSRERRERLGVDERWRVLLVSSRPPLDDSGGWNRLSVSVLGGFGTIDAPGLLTSATTRTRGLISNLDIAPTLLAWLGVSQPAHMRGHPISTADGSLTDLQRMDALTRANARGIVPIFAVLGAIAAIAGFGGLLAVRLGRGAGLASALMLILSNFPLAMLLVVMVHPKNVLELGAHTGILMLGLTVLEYLAGRTIHQWQPRLSVLHGAVLALDAFTVFTILIDALFGQYLIKFSLFSSYQVNGIRFYGIGNEYMGVLVGMALVLAFLGGFRPLAAAVLFGVAALVLGLPSLGADAGGLVAALVAFGIGVLILAGRKADWRHAAAFTVLGFLAAFLLAFLDRAVSGAESSHLGGAIESASTQGWGALLEIIERKARMNLTILLNPFTMTAIAGAIAVVILVGGPLRAKLASIVEHYPGWRRGIPAAAWGALAAFLFNDSGAVPAIFILGAFISSGLILLFAQPRKPESSQS